MGRADAISDILKGLGRLFLAPKPSFPRYQPPVRPRPDLDIPVPRPDPVPPPLPPVRPRLPRVPPLTNKDDEAAPAPEAAPEATPEGQTEGRTRTDTEGDEECEICPECIARERGRLVPVPYRRATTPGPPPPTQQLGYAYQHFVVPWFAHDTVAHIIDEWEFGGVRFDGLEFATCHLFEAKFGYDNWFIEDFSDGGRPEPTEFAAQVLLDGIFDEAIRQWGAVKGFYPDVRLTWVFSSLVFKIFMTEFFLRTGMVPPIDSEYRPYP